MLKLVQSIPKKQISGLPNFSRIISEVNSSMSICKLLGNCSSQSTVKHSCPLFRNALLIHSVPLNNSNTFNFLIASYLIAVATLSHETIFYPFFHLLNKNHFLNVLYSYFISIVVLNTFQYLLHHMKHDFILSLYNYVSNSLA